MPYRLKFGEPVDKGWRRIADEQIATSIELLSSGRNVPAAVHETRKAMKRVRALLKLLRSAFSDADYKRENKRFGDIGRMLSAARDADVLAQRAAELARRTTGKSRAAALALAQSARKTASKKPGGDLRSAAANGHLNEAIAALEAARKSIDRLELSSKSFTVVRKGLMKSYRQGRRIMGRCYDGGVDEDFHEWRKAVQAHWRHTALVSRAWPDMFEARMQLAKEMSDLLGEDHDLYVMIGAAKARETSGAEGAGFASLVRSARARQAEIREELRAKGEALYAEDADEFVARVEAYWKAATDSRKRMRAARKAKGKSTAGADGAARPAVGGKKAKTPVARRRAAVAD